jgi:hypothetical protein
MPRWFLSLAIGLGIGTAIAVPIVLCHRHMRRRSRHALGDALSATGREAWMETYPEDAPRDPTQYNLWQRHGKESPYERQFEPRYRYPFKQAPYRKYSEGCREAFEEAWDVSRRMAVEEMTDPEMIARLRVELKAELTPAVREEITEEAIDEAEERGAALARENIDSDDCAPWIESAERDAYERGQDDYQCSSDDCEGYVEDAKTEGITEGKEQWREERWATIAEIEQKIRMAAGAIQGDECERAKAHLRDVGQLLIQFDENEVEDSAVLMRASARRQALHAALKRVCQPQKEILGRSRRRAA